MMTAMFLLLSAQAAPAAVPPPPPPTSGVEGVVTPDKGNAGQVLERAANRPLRDLNLVKPKVAPELAAIMARPYMIKSLRTCRQLGGEVRRMTALVGPDVDDPAMVGRKGRTPAETLLDSAESITGSLVPGQGIIRQLTGANKSARYAAAARLAGQFRRSYIKGVMSARGCRLVLPGK